MKNEAVRFCSQCGAKRVEGDKLCRSCGVELAPDNATVSPRPAPPAPSSKSASDWSVTSVDWRIVGQGLVIPLGTLVLFSLLLPSLLRPPLTNGKNLLFLVWVVIWWGLYIRSIVLTYRRSRLREALLVFGIVLCVPFLWGSVERFLVSLLR